MKQTLLFISFISITFLVQAQNIFVGPTAGFGHSWITNLGGNRQFQPSWNAGASLVCNFKSHLGLGVDVKFSSEGSKDVFNESPFDGPTHAIHTVTSNYMRLPLKIIYFFGKNNRVVQPKIYIGPDFGFLISERTDLGFYNPKRFDFGGNAGAGLNFRLSKLACINTDVVYYNGFTNVSKHNNIIDAHNNNLQFNIGLLVFLKKK